MKKLSYPREKIDDRQANTTICLQNAMYLCHFIFSLWPLSRFVTKFFICTVSETVKCSMIYLCTHVLLFTYSLSFCFIELTKEVEHNATVKGKCC